MSASRMERILILAKTYPSPSASYVETSCVAGITDTGMMRRLYPVPFRMIDDRHQFKKWQWINVRVEKASKDHRPESHRVYVDTIQCGDVVSSKHAWAARWPWLDKMPCFDRFDTIEETRRTDGLSLALLRPARVDRLEITPARHSDWTDEEREKLLHEQMQGELFETEERRSLHELRKIPFDFYYHYTCAGTDGETSHRHKLVDWEAGALYWNCVHNHGDQWEVPFRAKLEHQMLKADLMFLLGNMHRFQDKWLITSLIYPPKRTPTDDPQLALL